MEVNDYVIQYPIDAVHTVKFAELLGKPETAVVKMVKENKLPVIELRDPSKPNARVGEKWVSFQSLIALYERRFITDQLNSVMHGFCGWGCDYE
ncbi:Cox protein [Escherichia coli]|uniref:Cox protein n=2 Tax=Escherichia coli TaxID=562 RepID=A0A376LEW4_ECOLX|nr:Cox protein [Escherichia coli]